MMIIGCDCHPRWQQVSWLDMETGETGGQKLIQASGNAEPLLPSVFDPQNQSIPGRIEPSLLSNQFPVHPGSVRL